MLRHALQTSVRVGRRAAGRSLVQQQRMVAPPLRPLGSRSIFGGLMDKGKEYMQDNQMKKAADFFEKEMAKMAAYEKYNITHMHESTKAQAEMMGVTGWKSKLPGVDNQPGVDAIKLTLALQDAMIKLKLLEPHRFTPTQKQKIAALANSTVADVNSVVKQYRMQFLIFRWLKEQEKRGIPPPKTQYDMEVAMRKNPPKQDKKLSRRTRI